MIARPGQRVNLLIGRDDEEGGLQEGMRLELEPNVGANDYVVDLRMSLESAGDLEVEISQGLTLVSGRPVVVLLGRPPSARILFETLHCPHSINPIPPGAA